MLKTKKWVAFFIFLLIPFIPSMGHSLDTDLYVLTGANIPPNVLIILDSSASMDEVSSGQLYSSAIDYSPYVPPTGTIYPMNQVYIKSSGNKWIEHTIQPACPALQDLLNQFGEAINFSGCGYNKKDFQIGNFRNYLQATGGPGGNRPRFGLATGIIHSYINTTSGVRFAVMAFNRDKDGNTVRNNNGAEFVSNDGKDDPLVTPWDAVGGRLLGFVDENKNGKTDLFNELATLKNDSWSPLAETLYEAGIYFQKGISAITGTNYINSPIQYWCQKNYVLIISDGVPTKDSDPRLNGLIQDLNNDGKVDLDEVAKYLYGLDLYGEFSGKQNIKTYTIGFSMTQPLLEDTARNGGGKYFYVWSSQSFNIAFQKFIEEVLEESVSYVAPVVPISQMERTSAGNLMYLAMFKPTEKSFWKGNIKKYCIATKNISGEIVDCSGSVVTDPNIKVGDILDVNGSLVMDSNNEIKKTAQSYWSSVVDREYTDAGGVGEKLRTTSRNIYTYFGTNINLKDSSNAFNLSNGTITPELLGLVSGDTVGREALIKFIQGYDAYYENEIYPKGPSNKKDWILGAFIHSRPVVIHYEDRTVIYAGANDGMLHAFDDKLGEELWAFIPPNFLSKLQNLNGEALEFFVDGAPKAYIERDSSNKIVSAILIFGERRGGDRYIALDITNPLSPEFLWEIGPSAITYKTTTTNTTVYQELGQTWSAPQLGKIKYGDKWVAFVSGGYDENQDNQPVVASDTKGRAIYIVDILNGNLVWSYSNAKNPNMKYCIPSDIARVDTDGNHYIDRLYVGDVGGQVWRFDIGDSNISNWDANVKILFDSNKGESLKRKIFYPPEVTLEKGNYEMIFLGTGDREHPKDTTTINRLYAIKDKNPSATLSESDLVDVTQDWLQEGTSAQKTWTLNQLETQQGWFIALNQNLGEKCLSNSVIFYGDIYYTTFQPTFDPTGTDPCFLSEGIARLYALDYKTGNAAFNLDGVGTLNDLTRSDRSASIGASIPSGVIITFVGGTSVAYGGVGGGVYRPPLPIVGTIIPINWRIVF
jgi:type IV pilus assembly protein PilY1